ncbi:hypothetical protein GCM10009835_35120 [Planosporangium flavigriseum]|uniref:Uncharacterized protein n=1 Tax=Planosporangium flavigriseum TaxID=373681 RepID=A0A8J3LJK5_9ACTN|nr:hypothetical protein Pfl04_13560 [Planosporangium flavigriseum]
MLVRVGRDAPTIGGSERIGVAANGLGERTGVQDTGDAKRTPEGAAPLRQRETRRVGMNMCSPARPSACRIGNKAERISAVLDRDCPQQLGGWHALPATHTGAYRPSKLDRRRKCATYHLTILPSWAFRRLARLARSLRR